jgi:lipoprotein-anchoring transpeptidase ErfK/SrfK
MRDTSTTTYYNQMVQGLNDLVSSGVTAIQLLNLKWGPITLQNATTAQATTTETWSTKFTDGSVLQSTDANVYTLVLQSGAWLIQADQHPNSQPLLPSGTPGAAPTPVTPIATVGPGQSSSRNWAGYAATGGTFTSVSGTWTVPNVTAGSIPAADATWVGIGGVSTKDLIQAGTDATVQGGQVVYTAWWETLPQSSQPVPLTVSPGDTMSVSIAQQPNGTWQIVIRDTTSGQSWQNNLTYQSSLSSAEWIEESPSVGRRTMLPLDNFGTVTFTGATTVENGQQRTTAQAGGQPIIMTNTAGQALAQPSALGANGVGFTVTRTSVTAPRVAPGSGYVPNNTLAGVVPAILTSYHTTGSTTEPEQTPAPAPQTVNSPPGGQGVTRWIDVNIATQTLRAYEGDGVVFQTLISGGVTAHPTVKGTFHIFQKLVADDMRGGSGASAYYLPNVPYVMYFAEGGYALHGTYWHHNFGHPMSHGCVNMATPDVKWLYNWAPLGTTVVVH